MTLSCFIADESGWPCATFELGKNYAAMRILDDNLDVPAREYYRGEGNACLPGCNPERGHVEGCWRKNPELVKEPAKEGLVHEGWPKDVRTPRGRKHADDLYEQCQWTTCEDLVFVFESMSVSDQQYEYDDEQEALKWPSMRVLLAAAREYSKDARVCFWRD